MHKMVTFYFLTVFCSARAKFIDACVDVLLTDACPNRAYFDCTLFISLRTSRLCNNMKIKHPYYDLLLIIEK